MVRVDERAQMDRKLESSKSATLAGCVTRGPILTWGFMGLPLLKPCISVLIFFQLVTFFFVCRINLFTKFIYFILNKKCLYNF
jgi:hypothetical protein